MPEFREKDFEDEGRIVREAGELLANELAKKSPELFSEFKDLCEYRNRRPKIVLGEKVVAMMNDETTANEIASVEPNIDDIKSDNYRIEDIEFIEQIAEKLGINFKPDTGNEDDFIRDLVQERIKKASKGPFDGLDVGPGEDSSSEEELEEMKSDIDDIKGYLQEQTQPEGDSGVSEEPESEEDVDDLLDSVDVSEEDDSTEVVGSGDVEEVESEDSSSIPGSEDGVTDG